MSISVASTGYIAVLMGLMPNILLKDLLPKLTSAVLLNQFRTRMLTQSRGERITMSIPLPFLFKVKQCLIIEIRQPA